MTTETRLESRIAYLNDTAGSAGTKIHGVALGEGDIAEGAVNGEPRRTEWPADVLQEAAETLEGKPIIDVHSDEGTGAIDYPPPADITVGKFEKVAYEPGVGVIYEGTLADSDLAEKIEAGILEISPEIGFDTDDETADPIVPTEAAFFGGAIVSVGAAPSNSVETGANPALATLSAAGVSALLETDDPDTEIMGEDSDGDTDNEGAESSADTENTDMGDDNPTDDDPSVEALVERLDEREKRIDELEESLDDVQAENEDLRSEVTEVKEAYATALSDSSPFSEEELVENFDVATLRSKADELDVSVTPDTEPDTQTGAGEGEDTPNLDEATLEEAEDLVGRADMLESADAEYANTLREQAADKVGVDDYDAVLEVLD